MSCAVTNQLDTFNNHLEYLITSDNKHEVFLLRQSALVQLTLKQRLILRFTWNPLLMYIVSLKPPIRIASEFNAHCKRSHNYRELDANSLQCPGHFSNPSTSVIHPLQ